MIVYDAVANVRASHRRGDVRCRFRRPCKKRTRRQSSPELYPAEDLKEALDEVQELINAEELYTKDIYQT